MEPIAEAVELDEGDLLFEGHGSTPRGAQQQHASASHSDSDAELGAFLASVGIKQKAGCYLLFSCNTAFAAPQRIVNGAL